MTIKELRDRLDELMGMGCPPELPIRLYTSEGPSDVEDVVVSNHEESGEPEQVLLLDADR